MGKLAGNSTARKTTSIILKKYDNEMVKVSIEENEDEVKFLFEKKNDSIVVTYLSLIGAIASIGLIIRSLFIYGPGMQFLFVTLFLLIVFYLTLKRYLWNTRGKEILTISQSKIDHLVDYGLYKDQVSMKNKDLKIDIELVDGKPTKDYPNVIDSGNSKYTKDGIVRLKMNVNVALQINAIISSHDLEFVEKTIGNYLK